MIPEFEVDEVSGHLDEVHETRLVLHMLAPDLCDFHVVESVVSEKTVLELWQQFWGQGYWPNFQNGVLFVALSPYSDFEVGAYIVRVDVVGVVYWIIPDLVVSPVQLSEPLALDSDTLFAVLIRETSNCDVRVLEWKLVFHGHLDVKFYFIFVFYEVCVRI